MRLSLTNLDYLLPRTPCLGLEGIRRVGVRANTIACVPTASESGPEVGTMPVQIPLACDFSESTDSGDIVLTPDSTATVTHAAPILNSLLLPSPSTSQGSLESRGLARRASQALTTQEEKRPGRALDIAGEFAVTFQCLFQSPSGPHIPG
ncbi:hypothetical protein AK830_g11333 [Neonectria ditissima]|uniref:Uncharacterized protein n=1 Tax=Neonectria ditissima TaxID=78410 RepID=A0A0P7B3B0_9HYPO|nr:hypothetical protein AK830_g11333 [Neonectria ditissima]